MLFTSENKLFFGVKVLSSFKLPKTIEFINSNKYTKCSLEKIIVPENVEEITEFCFSDLDFLKSIVMPQSLKKIGNYAFYKCKNLLSVNIPSSCSIGENIFFKCPIIIFSKKYKNAFCKTEKVPIDLAYPLLYKPKDSY